MHLPNDIGWSCGWVFSLVIALSYARPRYCCEILINFFITLNVSMEKNDSQYQET